MIRTLLATTALAALLSTGVIAQDAAAPAADPAAPAATTEAPADPAAGAAADPAAGAATTNPAAGEELDATDVGAQDTNDGMNANNMGEPWDMSAGYVGVDTDNLASQLIDQPVYSSAGDDAEEIGNVTDLVFSESGQINAVVIGVGGFLGIGEKSVAVDFRQLEFVVASDNTERWVLPTSADALNAAPDFVWEEDTPDGMNAAGTEGGAMAPADPAMAPADPAAGNAMAPADDGEAADPAVEGAADPAAAPATDDAMAPATDDAMAPADTTAMPREGYQSLEFDALTAENVTGATVVGPDGNDIAEVQDILLTQDGQIDALLVDFGGFLGLGQKTVAVGMENLEFAANEGGDVLIYSDFTREQLEAAPEYDEAAYAADPATQRATDM